MALPPDFLDELRARVGLTDVIARHVQLRRNGREASGLCPFHNEKSPSFTVSEEKGFFHCFGCGAHGDVIGFLMRIEGLSFPEAVERLAHEAGLEMPKSSPEERARARRAADLYEAMEAACRHFEAELAGPRGREAAAYLARRGFDPATIARFRIGYAPDSRTSLRNALISAEMPEALLVEAGLLIRPDDGTPYDRFRGRVMFPITDRRGRVIAFGGRILGEGKPKYLNSPDTPLFEKGRVLYGLAQARRAAHDTGRVTVVEGYTDVIALARAGIAAAVAPLGTALTESHLHLLWRMADEPTLCFDGDEAGRRAAWRAAERALPLLAPGRSLGFVALPAGEDPDSLLAGQGPAALHALLDSPRSLAEVLWEMATAAKKLDTPERRAGIERALIDLAARIDDRTVHFQYRDFFLRRLRETTRGTRGPARRPTDGRRESRPPMRPPGPGARPEVGPVRREQVVIAALVNHPRLASEFAADLARLNLSEPKLDKLLREILLLTGRRPGLDAASLKRQLSEAGFAEMLDVLLCAEVYVHGHFARPEAAAPLARGGLREALGRMTARFLDAARAEAEMAVGTDPSDANLTRLTELASERLRAAEAMEAAEAEAGDSRIYAASGRGKDA